MRGRRPVSALVVLVAALVLPVPGAAATIQDLEALTFATPDPARDRAAERVFRTELRNSKDRSQVAPLYGRWLFLRNRPIEAYPFLEEGCLTSKDERTCAATAAIALALGHWADARRVAVAALEVGGCRAFSERLWVTRLIADDAVMAVTAAEGLLRNEGGREMSHILLAAAMHRSGREEEAQAVLDRARSVLERPLLLDLIRWGATAGTQ
ncbi:MAG: hypothetical protein ACYDBY_11030 [Thermoanaerobaculia bacterium]